MNGIGAIGTAEIIGILASLFGTLLFFVGTIWLIVLGFKRGGVLWAALIFFFSWLAGIIFCVKYKTGWLQLILIILGGIIAGVGAVPLALKMMQQMNN